MEFAKSNARRHDRQRSAANTILEIKIENFRAATERLHQVERYPHPFIESFSVSVYPDGVDERTEGWLVVLPNVDVKDAGWIPKTDVFSCIVSIVDVEGNSRIPRSFEEIPYDYYNGRYLERTFILEKESEFLPEGVLTLSCDFHFTWIGTTEVTDYLPKLEMDGYSTNSSTLKEFLWSIPKEEIKRNAEKGEDTFTVYDFTHKVLSLPHSQKLRERFCTYPGVSPGLDVSEAGHSEDIGDHVWIFDTSTDRFLLFIEEEYCWNYRNKVGRLLVKNSTVLKRCVSTPMKEQREKRIELSNVDSQTFKIVLFYLENETFPPVEFHDLVGVYKMSHFYEMRDLQIKCSKYMVRCFELSIYYSELKRIADFHSDEYLESLIRSRDREYYDGQMKHSLVIKEDRPDTDFYV